MTHSSQSEETEDSEMLAYLPKVKLARDGAQVGLGINLCCQAGGRALRRSEDPPSPAPRAALSEGEGRRGPA